MHRRDPWRLAALGALALALVVRVVYVLAVPYVAPVGDGVHYLGLAVYLARSGHLMGYSADLEVLVHHLGQPQHHLIRHVSGPDAYWPPLFVMVLAAMAWVYSLFVHVGGPIAGMHGLVQYLRIMLELFGVATVALVGLLALRLFGRRVAVVVLFIAALFPPFIALPYALLSECLSIPLILLMVLWTLDYLRTRRTSRLVLAAAMVGLDALTRVQGLALAIPLCVALWPWRRAGAGRLRVRALAPIGVALLVIVLILTPWTVRNEVKYHHLVPLALSGGNTLLGVYNAQAAASPEVTWVAPKEDPYLWRAYFAHAGNQWQQNADLQRVAVTYAENHPLYVLRVIYWNVRRFLDIQPFAQSSVDDLMVPSVITDVSVFAFWLVAILAIAGAFTRAARAAPKWIWLVPLVTVLTVLPVTVVLDRFQITIDPFVILLAGVAIEWLAQRRPGAHRELRTDDRSGSGSGNREHGLWGRVRRARSPAGA